MRFIVVWIFSFAPLTLVGYGIRDAESLQSVLVQIQRELFPAYRERMLQHEAGHFLIGHLLGFPVQGYQANAVKNAVSFYGFADPNTGREAANLLGFDKPRAPDDDMMPVIFADRPYYSEEGRGGIVMEQQSVFREDNNYTSFMKLDDDNDPSLSWPFRSFDETTLDKITAISVAGVCAEILAFGNAEGGLADLNQLRQIFATSDVPEKEAENRIRFSLGYTISQLRRNLGALDALVDVMRRNGSISECINAMEECKNVSGEDGILDDYERRRRESIREQGTSWIERVFLGGDKNIDTMENRYVEGKGGGSRKEEIRLTGDDPLYLAVAVAAGFFLWASAGGLTLH